MTSFLKDKKIIAYIALKHHTRFIIPIMEALKAQGAKIQYIVGSAERSQEITAMECGIDYVHAFDYTDPSDQKAVDETYHLLRDGFVEGIKKDVAIGASVLLTVLDKNLHATAREYIGFKNFLEREKPDLCLALHELNRWGKMLSFWAKKMNIPFFTLQEGLYAATDYLFIGHVQFSTMDLVWGEKTRQKLIGYEAPADRVIAVGNTHIAQEIKLLEKNKTRQKKRKAFGFNKKFVVLLLFSALPSPHNEILPLFKYFKATKDRELIVKFHPVTTQIIIQEWTEKFPKEILPRMIHGEESTYDLMAAADLCVLSEPSTTGLEALAIGKPLVQLKLKAPAKFPYDFVKSGVARHLSPEELIKELDTPQNFSRPIDTQTIKKFIQEELTDTSGATQRITDIFEKAIAHNQAKDPAPLSYESPAPSLPWSIIVPVPLDPQIFLIQLESIAAHSEGSGDYEVILLVPPDPSPEIQTILESLEGDVRSIQLPMGTPTAQAMNMGARISRGKTLVFTAPHLAPHPNWLAHLKNGVLENDKSTPIGGMIISPNDNIIHAGINVDINNSPTPAYPHLDSKFPKAQEKKHFAMVDHFIGIDRDFFKTLGGFHPASGRYAFMDLCLSAGDKEADARCLYIPEIKFTQVAPPPAPGDENDALYFYARRHGVLWENEVQFHANEEVDMLQLDAARLTRAMELVGKL